jgi:aromatic ring-opening dioxygenase catalytic subunit (LigB family)
MTNEHPPMLFDYYGFPAESYTLTWPAPGSPAVAARVRQQLDAAGFASGANDARGFDHGAFVPLKLAWLRTAVTDEAWKRDQALTTWTTAPSAHVAHPRAEHLMPLMVVAGAAGADRGTMAYSGTVLGIRISAYHSGALPTVA